MKINEKEFYKPLAFLIQKVEGQIIQDFYYLIKDYKLDGDKCDGDNEGNLIPSTDDIWEMRELISAMFLKRHIMMKSGNYYADLNESTLFKRGNIPIDQKNVLCNDELYPANHHLNNISLFDICKAFNRVNKRNRGNISK
jgi:hypothetical protein